MMTGLPLLPSLPSLVLAQPVNSPTTPFDAIFNGATPLPTPSHMAGAVRTPSMPVPMPISMPMPIWDMMSAPELNPALPSIAVPVEPTIIQPDAEVPAAVAVAVELPPPPIRPADQAMTSAKPPAIDEDVIVELPSAEALKTAPATEAIIAAQVIVVAVQVAPTPTKPPIRSELPQKIDVAMRATKPAAPDHIVKKPTPVRPTNINVAVGFSKPQPDRLPAEAPMIEAGPVVPNDAIAAPNYRPTLEPFALNIPAAITPAIATPQMFHELDLARDLAWIGNLAQEIVTASDDRDTLSFRLMPRSMGQLDVDLSRSPDGLRLEMTATTERAQQIIAAEQPRLIEELRQSGVKTVGTDLASGENNGSQRGHLTPRNDLPFAALKAQPPTSKPGTRPDSRFA